MTAHQERPAPAGGTLTLTGTHHTAEVRHVGPGDRHVTRIFRIGNPPVLLAAEPHSLGIHARRRAHALIRIYDAARAGEASR